MQYSLNMYTSIPFIEFAAVFQLSVVSNTQHKVNWK